MPSLSLCSTWPAPIVWRAMLQQLQFILLSKMGCHIWRQIHCQKSQVKSGQSRPTHIPGTRRAHLLGSSHGRLIYGDDLKKCFLINPLANTRIDLPRSSSAAVLQSDLTLCDRFKSKIRCKLHWSVHGGQFPSLLQPYRPQVVYDRDRGKLRLSLWLSKQWFDCTQREHTCTNNQR